MTTSEREHAYERIAKFLYEKPDGEIPSVKGPYFYRNLSDYELPLPQKLPAPIADNTDGLFVDEICAYEDDLFECIGVRIYLSVHPRYRHRGCRRVASLALEDADDKLLTAILEAVTPACEELLPANERSADDIVADARRCLEDIIAGNVKTLHYRLNDSSPDFAAGEDYTADVDDYDCGKVHFRVTVSDLHTDYEAVEDRTVRTVRVTADDGIFVESEEDDGCETSADELSTDELAALARWSEQAAQED